MTELKEQLRMYTGPGTVDYSTISIDSLTVIFQGKLPSFTCIMRRIERADFLEKCRFSLRVAITVHRLFGRSRITRSLIRTM